MLLIDGVSQQASGRQTYDIISPSSGNVIGRAAAADATDVHRAVINAQETFFRWSQRTAYEREAIVRQATQHVRTRAEEIGRLMALEQGKPWKQSTSEVLSACDLMDFYAAEGPRIEGTIHPTEKPNYHSWVIHQPVGGCAAITPWNYPVALLSWKIGPALAAGCTVVVKPTPITSLCVSAFCLALVEGGLPAGVVNVITGPDAALGQALVEHPHIAKVAMTGSTKVGKRILESCAPTLKRVSVELGGHCPAIVCADTDLDLAAQVIAYKGFRNGGQSCSSVNRVFVHESAHDALAERLVAQAEAMT
ncbi:MAG: succinate-semialdehyde dehydrogenase/glutarate-semialdehyde dehydrogenase [Verrucomicrobiales bacterium]